MTREEWLEARRTGIGGSDIAAVLGISPWRTALDVWRAKIEPAPDPVDPPEPMYWGQVLEVVVASEYQRRTQQRVQRISGIIRMPGNDWAIASIDRAVIEPGRRARLANGGGLIGAQGVLECKTAHAHKLTDWGRDDDPDAVPVHHAAQGMWYLAVAGLPWCDFAVLIGGQRFLIRRLERDEDVIRAMLERAEEFWRRHVLERVPPAPQNSKDVISLFPSDTGETIEADEELLAAYNAARAAKAKIAEAEAEFEAAAGRIKLALGERSALTMNGIPIVTWKTARPTRKTDWKAVCEEALVPAEIIDRHTAEQPGSRRFLIKEI